MGKDPEGLEQREGIQRYLVINSFPRALSRGSRWPIPGGLDLSKQLLPGPGSNSWGHRTLLHKRNGRNQWVPLCLHAEALLAGPIPVPGWSRGLGKRTLPVLRLHLQINGKTQWYKAQFYLNYLDFAKKLRC